LSATARSFIFIWLAMLAKPQPIAVDVFWTVVLSAAALAVLLAAGRVLCRWYRDGTVRTFMRPAFFA
jgi:hypothetical protein